MKPDFAQEESLWAHGYHLIAGIDEVGRGPLAGPVVAAAVILPSDLEAPWLGSVRDSKELTPRMREFLSRLIRQYAIAIGIGEAPPVVIERQGIVGATRMAMRLAVERLPSPPDFLLIDHVALPEVGLPQRNITHGDSLSLSIAAASIVAKVERDHLMIENDGLYPGYGFARNKGYATPDHLESLRRLGLSPIHRRSFAPVRSIIAATG